MLEVRVKLSCHHVRARTLALVGEIFSHPLQFCRNAPHSIRGAALLDSPPPLSLISFFPSDFVIVFPSSLPPSIHRGDFLQHPSVSLESRGTGEREDKKSTWKGNASARGRGACVGRGAEGDSNSTKREWMTIRMGTTEGKAFQVN